MRLLIEATRHFTWNLKPNFEQMGEKSFDHTKKYWFNKLRREYPLPVEVKTEKPKIENPLAEQTITESLAETAFPAVTLKTGFVPRFKANLTTPPVIDEKSTEPYVPPHAMEENPGYYPRFITKSNGLQSEITDEDDKKPEPNDPVPAKPAYKPRFNMKNVPPKSDEE